jgi:hypothetical protein
MSTDKSWNNPLVSSRTEDTYRIGKNGRQELVARKVTRNEYVTPPQPAPPIHPASSWETSSETLWCLALACLALFLVVFLFALPLFSPRDRFDECGFHDCGFAEWTENPPPGYFSPEALAFETAQNKSIGKGQKKCYREFYQAASVLSKKVQRAHETTRNYTRLVLETYKETAPELRAFYSSCKARKWKDQSVLWQGLASRVSLFGKASAKDKSQLLGELAASRIPVFFSVTKRAIRHTPVFRISPAPSICAVELACKNVSITVAVPEGEGEEITLPLSDAHDYLSSQTGGSLLLDSVFEGMGILQQARHGNATIEFSRGHKTWTAALEVMDGARVLAAFDRYTYARQTKVDCVTLSALLLRCEMQASLKDAMIDAKDDVANQSWNQLDGCDTQKHAERMGAFRDYTFLDTVLSLRRYSYKKHASSDAIPVPKFMRALAQLETAAVVQGDDLEFILSLTPKKDNHHCQNRKACAEAAARKCEPM